MRAEVDVLGFTPADSGVVDRISQVDREIGKENRKVIRIVDADVGVEEDFQGIVGKCDCTAVLCYADVIQRDVRWSDPQSQGEHNADNKEYSNHDGATEDSATAACTSSSRPQAPIVFIPPPPQTSWCLWIPGPGGNDIINFLVCPSILFDCSGGFVFIPITVVAATVIVVPGLVVRSVWLFVRIGVEWLVIFALRRRVLLTSVVRILVRHDSSE